MVISWNQVTEREGERTAILTVYIQRKREEHFYVLLS